MGRSIMMITSAMQTGVIVFLLWGAGPAVSYALTNTTLSNAEISGELRRYLHGENSAGVHGYTLHSSELLNEFYTQRAYRPAWLDQDYHLIALSDVFMAAIAAADQEGLQSGFYHQQPIADVLEKIHNLTDPGAARYAELELLISDAFFTYASHMTHGRLNPRQLNPDWSWQSRSFDLVALLEQALTTGDIVPALQYLQPPHEGYRLLKAALAHYRNIAQAGGWPAIAAGGTLHKNMRDPRVKALRARLRASGDLAAETAERQVDGSSTKPGPVAPGKAVKNSETLFSEELHQAVLRFQKRHGLSADGLVGKRTLAAMNVPVAERIRQIELNMERWRWLPENLGERHILVNIAGFEMQVVENGKAMLRSKVVVGRDDRPTPVFTSHMSHLVISPYWNVPHTIAVKDKLPILRKNPYALRRQNIRVFNSAGREVNPGRVNWYNVGKRNFNYRLRQDPGPNNALGTIKFMFPNRHSVYLHDTSSPELFKKTERAYSSGCIRIDKPMELAEYLLRDNPDWNRKTITSAIERGRQRQVMLSEEIPVHLLYWTAWQDDEGLIHFSQDIYQHDQSLVQALNTIETRYAGL